MDPNSAPNLLHQAIAELAAAEAPELKWLAGRLREWLQHPNRPLIEVLSLRQKVGRPEISDAAALAMMVDFNAKRRAAGAPDNDREAARDAIRALGIESHNPEATVDRLRRKLRRQRVKSIGAKAGI